MNKIIFFSFLLFSNSLFSQNISQNVIIEYEDTLSVIAHTIMNGETEKIITSRPKRRTSVERCSSGKHFFSGNDRRIEI